MDNINSNTVVGTIDANRELVSWAAELGTVLAANAARHDDEGSWVDDSFSHLRDSGFLAAAVPAELGGRGATISEIATAQRELAHHCASTALASAMHQHVTCFMAWRYRRGMPGAEAVLRRIADDHIVLVSSGGADFNRPRGTAVKVEGGYRVSGHKVFASQAPAGTVLSTMFTYDDPDQGRPVLNTTIPLDAEGVMIGSNWDSLGMRGTASHDVAVEDVFVPEEKVSANRPWGVVDPPLQVIATIAMPIITAVYLGVAEAAFSHALEAIGDRRTDPIEQRRVGLMDNSLRLARFALQGALAAAGDDPTPSMETVAEVMAAKRAVAELGIAVCDLAMETAGGRAFFRGHPIERAYRDIRAAKFHPFDPEATLLHAGRLALGEPCDEV